MKKYEELTEEQKETAREFNPEDYENWEYQFRGVEIEFCAK